MADNPIEKPIHGRLHGIESILERGRNNYLKYVQKEESNQSDASDVHTNPDTPESETDVPEENNIPLTEEQGNQLWGNFIESGEQEEKHVSSTMDYGVAIKGVEMSFQEQTEAVTMAEVLISQGRIEEAREMYLRLSKFGGMTPWVTKRLKALSEQ